MKKLFFFLLIMFPVLAMAQGHKGEVDECAPMRNGKVCYRDTVHVNDMNQDQIFEVISRWAKKNYAKDVFLSNANSKKAQGNNKKFKTYPAESVIANNGKSNTIALIKDPKLFCNATFFFVENLFADILDAVNDATM